MRLLNTHNRLPGGWRYKQPDAKGVIIHEWKADFDPWAMFLAKVQAFRKANKLVRQDIHFVEADVTEYLAREFGADPRYFTDAGTPEAQKKTSHTPRYQSQRGAGFVENARNLYNGAQIIKEWLGEGGAIPASNSQNRADVCTGRLSGVPCPHNQPGLKLVEVAARFIQACYEKKNELKLSVEGEERLQSCGVCLCDLKLKVHVPMPLIRENTPQTMLNKFQEQAPANCWMLIENK